MSTPTTLRLAGPDAPDFWLHDMMLRHAGSGAAIDIEALKAQARSRLP